MHSSFELAGDVRQISEWQAFVKRGPRMIDMARQASKLAISYRNFRVGASALVVNPSGQIAKFKAANLKPYPDGPKQCAENALLSAVQKQGFNKVVGLFVTGPPQLDSASGMLLPTLHPCSDCRTLLAEHPAITDETVITTVNPQYDWFETYTRDELFAIHQVGEDDVTSGELNTHYDKGFATWHQGYKDFNGWLAGGSDGLSPAVYTEHHAARMAITGQLAAL